MKAYKFDEPNTYSDFMPRRKRFCPADVPSHVHKRGNNKAPCFRNEEDYECFVGCLAYAAKNYEVSIHAWVLMTNHFHLLVTPNDNTGVSKMMQSLGANYVKYFNDKYQRTGTLFEGRFRNHVVQTEDYFAICQRYIELNPVRAGMVELPGDYRWSSYHAHAYGTTPSFWSPHSTYLNMSESVDRRQEAYRRLFGRKFDSVAVEQIRNATSRGIPLGSESFRASHGY